MSSSVWAVRRERAAHLLREAPHAEQMLVFYIQLTEIQERIAERVPVDDWLRVAGSAVAGPPLRANQIPTEDLLALFEDFLAETTKVGTEVIAEGSRALLESEPNERRAALAEPAGFHVRAFLEPVLTTLAASGERGDEAGVSGHCPTCGSLPVVAVLQDLPDALGARSLVCSLCATRWRTDRLRCLHCGETSPDNLLVHTVESVPWVRIDECQACRRYLKTVDLRQRGDAVPVVDELATPELDLWARERGLTKVQVNVLEL